MSLATGKKIHRNSWTELLMGEDVLERNRQIAIDEGQVKVDNNFTYKWEPGNNFEEMEV